MTVRYIVSGHVQGVGYRWFARERAAVCDVTGCARNTFRGDVEIIAQGTHSHLNMFLNYLRMGPSRARVNHVSHEVLNELKIYDKFRIKM